LEEKKRNEEAKKNLEFAVNYKPRRKENFDPGSLHLFHMLKTHIFVQNCKISFEEIKFRLVKKSILFYEYGGYHLVALDLILELLDIVEKIS